MTDVKIILEVEGGIVKNVISTEPLEYIIVDWDNLEAGDDFPEMEDFRDDIIVTPDIEGSLLSLRVDNILKYNDEDEQS